MARTLDDFVKNSKKGSSDAEPEMRAVFDQTYSVARQVIELREKHGLTHVDLAYATGLTQAQISKIERGVINPTTTTLAKIGEALNADLCLVERSSI